MKFFARKNGEAQNETCRIYARVRKGGIDSKYTTGFTVLVSEWEKYTEGRYRASDWMKSNPISYRQFADCMKQIKEEVDDNFNPATISDAIKAIHDTVIFPEKKKKPKKVDNTPRTFSAYMQAFIDDLKSGRRTKQKKSTKVTESYTQSLTMSLNRVLNYEKDNGILGFDDIDMTFHHKFIAWGKSHGLTNNTFTLTLEHIRMIMKDAFIAKVTTSAIHLNTDFVPTRTQTDNIYLTRDQVNDLYEFDFSTPESTAKLHEIFCRKHPEHHPGHRTERMLTMLNKTRDLFIAGCLTGQRESDYFRFNKDMIIEMDDVKYLKFKQYKTKKIVIIPLDRRVEQIIEKYRGKMPHINRLTFSDNLRYMGELMGWTWDYRSSPDSGEGKLGERFCDKITSHTARRTFSTNAYAMGISASSIIAVTGHAREEGLRRYLRLSETDKAIIADQDVQGFMENEDDALKG